LPLRDLRSNHRTVDPKVEGTGSFAVLFWLVLIHSNSFWRCHGQLSRENVLF